MDHLNAELDLLKIQLDLQLNTTELTENELIDIINKFDSLVLANNASFAEAEPEKLRQILDVYLVWLKKSTEHCLVEKKRVADELVLFQKYKNANDHYQR